MNLKLIPLSLLCVYFVKVVAYGAGWTDAAILAILCGTSYLFDNKSQKEDVARIERAHNAIAEQVESLKKSDEELRTALGGLRINQLRKV